MERLAYTTRKTSGKKLKIGKISISLDLLTIVQRAKDVAIGFVLGIGSFMVLLSTFGLSWSHSDWPYGGVLDGMIETWNRVAKQLAAKDGVFLNQFESWEEETGLFLALVLLFLIAIGIVISLSRNKWFIIFYALLIGLPSVIWGIHPSVLAVAVLAAGVLLFVINSDMPDITRSYRGLIYSVVIAAAAFAIICIPALGGFVDRPQAIDNFRENVQEKAVDAYYGTNPLHDGDLTVKKRGTGKGVALEVTMGKPDSLYLRGFVGDVLEKDGWKPLSYATYYKNRNLFYWLGENGFNGLGQIAQSAALAEQGGKTKLNAKYEDEINEISIENVGANRKYAYVPYEISRSGVPSTKNWGDSFLTGGKLRKVKSYQFTTATNKVSTWTVTASKLFTNKVTPDQQKSYLENEAFYNEYVYKKFTYISNRDRKILKRELGDRGNQKRGHVEYNTAIKRVKKIITEEFEYTDSLSGYKKNKSALKNIFNTRSGYDAQLATAAVMMFRYYGIPARYVEGYLITQKDVATGASAVSVPRKNAHAWAEIYVDGVGFVPIEVCEEYKGLMKEADYSIGINTRTTKDQEDKSRKNNKNPNVKERKTKTNAVGGRVPSKALIIIGGLLALCLIILLIFLIRKLIRKIKAFAGRRKLFNKGEPREAVRAIYQHMDDKKITPDHETIDIGNRASYSIMPVTEADRTTMLGKLKTLKKKKADPNAKKKQKRQKNS